MAADRWPQSFFGFRQAISDAIIEKVVAHSDVGVAVLLLTPDDEGCKKGGVPEPRARQNVLFELGCFIGHLGRGKVCALKHGALEIPSDFNGVVWEPMDGNGGSKQSLARELQAAGYDVDWNKVMCTWLLQSCLLRTKPLPSF